MSWDWLDKTLAGVFLGLGISGINFAYLGMLDIRRFVLEYGWHYADIIMIFICLIMIFVSGYLIQIGLTNIMERSKS